MEHSSNPLISVASLGKFFRHPNEKLLKDFIISLSSTTRGVVTLNNCKKGERVEVNRNIMFSAMKISIVRNNLKILFHITNYKKLAQGQLKSIGKDKK